MNRRLLVWTAAVAAVGVLLGLAGLDRPIAEWLRGVGGENAPVFVWTLGVLDTISGMGLWIWLLGCVALGAGLVGFALRRDDRWPRALIAAALVQLATIGTMILGKDHFGRIRPQFVLESGDWSHVWFAGGNSFPSGHSAFYFGLLLPLAAASPMLRLRAALIAIPVFVVLARIDMAKHFLSDVSTSALIAALYALIVATAARHWLPEPPTASS